MFINIYFTFLIIYRIIIKGDSLKIVLIKLIKLYQKVPGSFHYHCRYFPTCSNYGIEAINEYGALKGSYLTCKRILKCNPFTKGGYDPVPQRSDKK